MAAAEATVPVAAVVMWAAAAMCAAAVVAVTVAAVVSVVVAAAVAVVAAAPAMCVAADIDSPLSPRGIAAQPRNFLGNMAL